MGFLASATFGQEVLVLKVGVRLRDRLSALPWPKDLLVFFGVFAKDFGPPTPPYLANPEPRLKNGLGESEPLSAGSGVDFANSGSKMNKLF